MDESDRERISGLAEFLGVSKSVVGTERVRKIVEPEYEERPVYACSWECTGRERKMALKTLKRMRRRSIDQQIREAASASLNQYKENKRKVEGESLLVGGLISAGALACIAVYFLGGRGCGS